ncbi:MAG TPA: hypothetical protein VNZ55_00135, partial [Thermomicrobiales bacterium]|nr:hypothetical protein [Thermomicrobiales bacterium]
MRSASIGTKGEGLGRLALNDDDRRMRDVFTTWCTEAGLTVEIDPLGNMFARRDGIENDLPAVMLGSHLDTQEE